MDFRPALSSDWPSRSLRPARSPHSRSEACLGHPHASPLLSSRGGCGAADACDSDLPRPRTRVGYLLVSFSDSRSLEARRRALGPRSVGGIFMTAPTGFPGLLQAFFTDRLMHQRAASPHTIASYRDTFRLLLKSLHEPSSCAVAQRVLAMPSKRFDRRPVQF